MTMNGEVPEGGWENLARKLLADNIRVEGDNASLRAALARILRLDSPQDVAREALENTAEPSVEAAGARMYRASRYRLGTFKVGEYRDYAKEDMNEISFRSNAYQFGKRHGWTFKVVSKDGAVRLTRVA